MSIYAAPNFPLMTARDRTAVHGSSALLQFLLGHGRSTAIKDGSLLVGRILITQIFLMNGAAKVMDWSGTEAQMAERGMFLIPFFHVAAIAVEFSAGLGVLLGFKFRLSVLMLFLFLIPVTLVFHNFWTCPPSEQQLQMINFLKNISIMGGLLLLFGTDGGSLSVEQADEDRHP